jgi:hypothetical protein
MSSCSDYTKGDYCDMQGYMRKQEMSTFLLDNFMRSDDLGNTGIDERIILKWILWTQNLNEWNCLKIGPMVDLDTYQ